MKKVLLAFVLFLIVVGGLYFSQNYLKGGSFFVSSRKTSTVTIGSHILKVTKVSSQKEREIGLSEAKSISSDRGMLFLFDKSDYYPFWMKNMKFSIDIIYINNDTIVTIKENAQTLKNNENPIIYTPTEPADKVLEIQSGLSKKYNFKNGDKVKYENLSN
jgi:uncharacterized protein